MEKSLSVDTSSIQHGPALNLWKVKLFLLNSEGVWDDYGCGILSFRNESNEEKALNKSEFIYIEKVFDESDVNLLIDESRSLKLKKNAKENMKDCLLYTKIEKDCVFDRQHDYIISWVDRQLEEEVAISFIDPIAANETWKKISSIAMIQQEKKMNMEELQMFPKLEPENLDLIISQLETQKERMIKSVIFKQDEVFEGLTALFSKVEKERNEEIMKKLVILIKSLIYSGDNDLIEIALNDKYYLTTSGILEYDGIEDFSKKSDFRKFLTEEIVFKKVFEIKNASILAKIHLNFRINFIYDCVLEPIIDEARPNPFAKTIYYNNCEILDYFLSENLLLDRFCQGFLDKLEDSLEFLKELFDLARTNIQPSIRSLLMEKFEAFGFFEILVKALPKIRASQMVQEKRIKYLILLMENFSYLLQIKTKPFTDILYSPNDNHGREFISNLVELLLFEDEGVQIQVTEFIKLLLDPSNEEKQQILTYLYDVLFVDLYDAYERMTTSESFLFFAQQYIDILIFCIHTHHTRIRYYIIKNEIIQHILKGLGLKKKIVLLAIAKFFKAIFQSKNVFLIRYVENNLLIKPLMEVFTVNHKNSKMFESVMLDIIKMIYSEDLDGIQKQCDLFSVMETQIVKNVIRTAKNLKEKKSVDKDLKPISGFSPNQPDRKELENLSNHSSNRKGILNLNLLSEEDNEIFTEVNEFDHAEKDLKGLSNKANNVKDHCDNLIINEENDQNYQEKVCISNPIEKRSHYETEEIHQFELDTTQAKKVKID